MRFKLDLDDAQARAVVKALDVANRLALGQIDEIAGLARQHEINRRDDLAPGGWSKVSNDVADGIEEHCRSIMALLGHPRGGSFGIGAAGVPDDAKRQYEVMKALRQQIAQVDAPGGNTVHHDGIGPRYTRDPLPVATRMGEAA